MSNNEFCLQVESCKCNEIGIRKFEFVAKTEFLLED